MRYQFKQAVHLAKKDYPRGVHEISAQVEQDPHFLKYVKLGWIVEAKPAQHLSFNGDKDRAEKLLNQLVAKKDAANKPKAAEPVEDDGKAKEEEEVEDFFDKDEDADADASGDAQEKPKRGRPKKKG